MQIVQLGAAIQKSPSLRDQVSFTLCGRGNRLNVYNSTWLVYLPKGRRLLLFHQQHGVHTVQVLCDLQIK